MRHNGSGCLEFYCRGLSRPTAMVCETVLRLAVSLFGASVTTDFLKSQSSSVDMAREDGQLRPLIQRLAMRSTHLSEVYSTTQLRFKIRNYYFDGSIRSISRSLA